jgi:hypothetical protein
MVLIKESIDEKTSKKIEKSIYDKIEKCFTRLYYFYLEKLSEVNPKKEITKIIEMDQPKAVPQCPLTDLEYRRRRGETQRNCLESLLSRQ